jgi:hypothetical protein
LQYTLIRILSRTDIVPEKILLSSGYCLTGIWNGKEKPMGRIPDDEIERLKRETDLAGLVRMSGVELAPHGAGRDLIGRCPLHDDRTPSLVVTPAKGLWHCLGVRGRRQRDRLDHADAQDRVQARRRSAAGDKRFDKLTAGWRGCCRGDGARAFFVAKAIGCADRVRRG